MHESIALYAMLGYNIDEIIDEVMDNYYRALHEEIVDINMVMYSCMIG